MAFLIATFLFLGGLCVGSFLNVLIYRLPHGLPLTGRSFCPRCLHQLAWFDNIPLLSFLLLRGKCRYCRKPISWQYPLVELATGVFFGLGGIGLIGAIGGIREIGDLLFFLFISSVLIVIFFSDLKYQIIPDQVVYPAIVLTSAYLLFKYYIPHTHFFWRCWFFSIPPFYNPRQGYGLG